MKRSTWIIIVIFLVIGLTVGTDAIAEESQPNDFDGIWVGSGDTSDNRRCSGGEIPVLFRVQDGAAKSLIQNERFMFETKVKKKGKMTFIYRNAASGSYQTSGQPIDIRFTGKLDMSSGKGNFSFGSGSGCRGQWAVEKQTPAKAKEIEFILYKNSLLMLSNGELVGGRNLKKGLEYIKVYASGDFFIILADDNSESGLTLFYKFDDPKNTTFLAALPNRLIFDNNPGLKEAKGVNFSIKDDKLYLSDDNNLESVIEPSPGKKLKNACVCGDFFTIHEGDDPQTGATVVYYYEDAATYSIVGVIRGEHVQF